MNLQHVLYEEKDRVAYITFNNPEKRNPISIEVSQELKQCFDKADYNDDIRVVVLRGAGGNFSGGGDINSMKARLDKGIREARPAVRMIGEASMRLRNIKKPTIAWVEGAAAGAGLSFAMCCDFSIASEESKMTFAFVNIGYVPDSGATYLVTRAVGTVKATELFMSGKVFNGAQARDWGLITDAVPADKLEETVAKYIRKYSKGPTTAYANIKAMINEAQFSELALGMQKEVEYQYACCKTDDHAEAVNAFLEKRPPNFTGK